MRLFILLLFFPGFFILSSYLSVYSQGGSSLSAAYNRIGLTPILFVNDTVSYRYSLKKGFKELYIPSKFDKNPVADNILEVTLPTMDLPEEESNTRSDKEKEREVQNEDKQSDSEKLNSMGNQLGSQLADMATNKLASELLKSTFKNFDNPLYDSLVVQYLKNKGVTRQIIDSLYNADKNGRYSMDRLIKRAKYNLNDAQAKKLKATAKGFEGSVKDAQWTNKILTSNYILGLQFHDIKRINPNASEGEGEEIKKLFNGYRALVTASVYHLDLNDSVRAVFYNNCWAGKNSSKKALSEAKSARRKMNYPLKKIKTYPLTVDARIVSSGESSDAEVFKKLPQLAFEKAIKAIEKDVDAFKVRASIFNYNSSIASHAYVKIGNKQGLNPDDRYFVYEYVADNNGELKQKCNGVLRATEVSQNDSIATGNTKPSEFLQTAGWGLGKGMLIEENQDMGLAIGMGYLYQGNSFLNMRFELRFSKTFNISPSWHAYGDFSMDFTQFTGFDKEKLSVKGDITENGDPETDVDIYSYGGGISKEFYFLNNFQFLPYLGIRIEKASFENTNLHDYLKDQLNEKYSQRKYMVDGGVRLGINITTWLKLRGSIGFSPISFDSEKSFFGEKVNKDMAEILPEYSKGDRNPFYLQRTPYKWEIMARINF